MDSKNYKENPEIKQFPDLDLVVNRFKKKQRLKAKDQIWMYESIARVWGVGKTILDVGCGIGIGTHILSREALGVYGVDVAEESIRWCKQYLGGPKVKFDVVDITQDEYRPTATFDVVAMIEVIEHIEDYDAALSQLKRFHDPKRNTVFFISSPNRNNPKLKQDGPRNKHHVREWTTGEFYEVLTKHFKYVVMYGVDKPNFFETENTVDGNTEITPVLAKCEIPIKEE